MSSASSTQNTFQSFLVIFHGYRRSIIWMALLFVLKMTPVWFVPIFIARMIDLIPMTPEDRGIKIWVYAFAFLVTLFINAPAAWYNRRILSRVVRSVGRDLRTGLCRQLQQLSLLYHDKTSVGKLHTKAIRDVEMVENMPPLFINTVLSFLIQVVIYSTTVAFRSPPALIAFIILVPAAALVRHKFNNVINQSVEGFRQSIEGMSGSMSDMMTMIPVTRAHGLEEQELTKVGERIDTVWQKGQTFDMTTEKFGISSFLTMGAFHLVFITGSVLASFHGRITIGDVVMFNSFFMAMTGQLSGVLSIIPQLAQANESVKSIYEVLNAPDLEANVDKKHFEEVEGGFKLFDVTYSYPGSTEPAVKALSLKVKEGETIALIGPSGCGKSTTIALLLGFIRPQSGSILLDGKNFHDMDLRTFRRHVGVVTQTVLFFTGTVRENVTYGQNNVNEDTIWESLELADAGEFVRSLPQGLDSVMGVNGLKLSGGQMQRLAIARAIVRDPKVLILDEPTSALDVESEYSIRKALKQVMKGRTVFLVSHRLSLVSHVDRILVMDKGETIALDTPENLKGFENYYSEALKKSAV